MFLQTNARSIPATPLAVCRTTCVTACRRPNGNDLVPDPPRIGANRNCPVVTTTNRRPCCSKSKCSTRLRRPFAIRLSTDFKRSSRNSRDRYSVFSFVERVRTRTELLSTTLTANAQRLTSKYVFVVRVTDAKSARNEIVRVTLQFERRDGGGGGGALEAATQTSPTCSRSSSFTWLSDRSDMGNYCSSAEEEEEAVTPCSSTDDSVTDHHVSCGSSTESSSVTPPGRSDEPESGIGTASPPPHHHRHHHHRYSKCEYIIRYRSWTYVFRKRY